MNPGPSIEEYVKAIKYVTQTKKLVPSVPYYFLLIASHVIDIFAKPFGINHPFSAVRIKKLVRSNNILPKELEKDGYRYRYSLIEAFEDWKKDYPEEW